MATSQARVAANQRNAARSTGPNTEAGKQRSRANALKHGLSGDGTGPVVAKVEAAEVDALAGRLKDQLRPSGDLGGILLGRVAAMAHRLDRCVRNELTNTAHRVRHAEAQFVTDRVAAAEKLGKDVDKDPEEMVRLLRQTPEGVDWLISSWRMLRGELLSTERPQWSEWHRSRVDHLQGQFPEHYPPTAMAPLARVVCGDRDALPEHQRVGLTPIGQREWARERLSDLIGQEIASLEKLRDVLTADPNEIADRVEAGDRALFDPSPEAQLAHRYEAAAERGLFRALRDFHDVEDRAREAATTAPPPTPPAAAPPPAPEPLSRPIRQREPRPAPSNHGRKRPNRPVCQTNPTAPGVPVAPGGYLTHDRPPELAC